MDNKKILIITGALYPHTSATTEISYRIANYLKKEHSCDIYMMGYSTYCDDKQDFPGFNTIHIEKIEQFLQFEKEYSNILKTNKIDGKIHKLLYLAKRPKLLWKNVKYKIHKNHCYIREFRLTIRKIINLMDFDCIITFFHPYGAINAVMKEKPKIPSIFYKIDLWSTDIDSNLATTRKKEKHIEEQADDYSDAIIITNTMYNEYLTGKIGGFEKNKEKIYVMQFPNVMEYERIKTMHHQPPKECINCIFTGSFHLSIRNPFYTIMLFRKLEQFGVFFHIYGTFTVPEKCELPSNIFFHGKVSHEESIRRMQEADFLVNVGNTTPNQFPSKILTYISLGKPILNIIKIPDCPTLAYTERYPLALNIIETEQVKPADVNRVLDFIEKKNGQSVPFKEIKELYPECTQEYVGQKVFEIITEITQKN